MRTHPTPVARLRLPLAVVAVIVLLVPVHASWLPPQTAAALHEILRDAVNAGDAAGIVALVIDRDGVVFEGSAGKRDVALDRPMRAGTIFRIHSMTKPITSLAALMLRDEGRLGLDDPVSRFLPSFAEPQVLVRIEPDGSPVTRPAKTPMTIRHLLTHTSGIGYGFSDQLLLQLTTKTGKVETELPLLHDPGARWTYGASTLALGHVVEKVAGMPLDEFLRARIFEPLGMRDTFYSVPPEKHDRVATRHQRRDGRLVEEPNAPVEQNPVRGDGGLYSTARDYAAFVQLFLNNGWIGDRRLVPADTIRDMSRDHLAPLTVLRQPDPDPARTRPFPDGAGRDGFTLGFQIAAAPPRGTAMRSEGSLSWGGLRNTHFWIDPTREFGVVVMVQVLPFYDERIMQVVGLIEEEVYRVVD